MQPHLVHTHCTALENIWCPCVFKDQDGLVSLCRIHIGKMQCWRKRSLFIRRLCDRAQYPISGEILLSFFPSKNDAAAVCKLCYCQMELRRYRESLILRLSDDLGWFNFRPDFCVKNEGNSWEEMRALVSRLSQEPCTHAHVERSNLAFL